VGKLKLVLNNEQSFDITPEGMALDADSVNRFMTEINADPQLSAFFMGAVQAGFNAGKAAACDAMQQVTEKKIVGGALWNCPAAKKVH
jgi:hypothetical protein